jgi:hypothetical protein
MPVERSSSVFAFAPSCDNFYLDARLAGEEVAGRASLDPGLFYKFRVAIKDPKHQVFIRSALPPAGSDGVRWRIPFSHHPAFCAGPHELSDLTPAAARPTRLF